MAGVVNGQGVRGRRKKAMTKDEWAESDRAKREASKARMAEKRAAKEADAAAKAIEKEAILDAILEMPIPNDGLDHERWPPTARLLARILSDPAYHGRDDAEIAEACALSLRQVKSYRLNDEFMAYANEVAKKNYASAMYPLLVQALLAGLSSGKPGKYVELAMKAMGMLIERKIVDGNITVDDKRQSTDELLEEIRRLEQGVDKSTGGVH